LTGRASQPSTHEELGRLAAALCDGEFTTQDSLRLDHLTRDPEALAFLSRYLILVGELHWSSVGTAPPRSGAIPTEKPATLSQSPQPRAVRSSSRVVRRVAAGIAGWAAAVVLAVLWWGYSDRTSAPAKEAARLLGSFSAVDSAGTPTALSDWVYGETKRIGGGVAAWNLPNGNTWIVEGPAAATLESPNRMRLEKGRAVFHIASPGEGFSVKTPFGRFIDRGTSFAVAVDETGTEMHVLAGAVAFRTNGGASDHAKSDATSQAAAHESARHGIPPDNLLRAGQAVRLDSQGRWRPISFAGGRFIRELPRRGSSSTLQFAALRAEHVLRVFSFESPDGRFRDRITGEPLLRTILKGGGDIAALSIEPGWGIGSQAVRVQRGNNNAVGAALQTESVFTPPGLFSIEAIFRYDGFPLGDRADAVGSVLATRGDRDRASFFLATAGDGTLMHLFDARENWLVTDGCLDPGHWYYAAATFANCNGRVVVNTWLADLSRGERQLRQVLHRGQAVGGLAPGPLAIGKGFDSAGAHAYAFPGAIDEVVLYNGIVGEDTLNEHLELLVGESSTVPPLPRPEAEFTAGKR